MKRRKSCADFWPLKPMRSISGWASKNAKKSLGRALAMSISASMLPGLIELDSTSQTAIR